MDSSQSQMRSRLLYLVAVIVVILIGLPARTVDDMPDFYVQYLGDALWAMMIFLLFRLLFPAAGTWKLALLALGVTWGIEFSQFIQADWINVIRGVKLGGLVLGYVFRWTDLAAYTCGIGTGVLLEDAILSKARSAR
jgi:glycopeptide antibiotics resistance protein